MSRFIQIVEVGARDGLQNEKAILDPLDRVALIRRLEACGVRRQEVVSFVNPARVPQMAGAETIMAALPSEAGRSRIGLVLNERGWDRCVAAGCDEANVVVCATDGFGIRNQGASVSDQLVTLATIADRRSREGGPPITLTVSVAFGCPFDGEIAPERVAALVRRLAAAGPREIALGDTIGVAVPKQVKTVMAAAQAAAPGVPIRLHFHDTRNTAIANAWAGLEAGAATLDASIGGIGGCPFAPNATGNVATEDLQYLLQRSGVETGLKLDGLIDTAKWISDKMGRVLPGLVSRAGGFPK